MKFMQKWKDGLFAKSAAYAQYVKWSCYCALCFYILCVVLSCAGRQSFTLHTQTGVFEHAIYAEEDHAPHPRLLTVSMDEDIHVWTNANDQIDLAVPIGLSMMYLVHTVPLILALWCLGRISSNIQNDHIFTEKNASYLLCCGVLQLLSVTVVPFVEVLIYLLVNRLADSRVSIVTGKASSGLLFGFAFFVAAYILQYGVHLQDEVDHTL